jgi:hypothetical protein
MVVKKIGRGLGFIFLLFFMLLGMSCVGISKRKAVYLAEEYLKQKYIREMKYLFVNSGGIDTAVYSVFFSPIDDPELRFQVQISKKDPSLPIERENEYGYFVHDNFLLQYFSLGTKRFFTPKIQEIWDANTSVFVVVKRDLPLSLFKVPIELNEQMETKEMETYLNYEIFIRIDLLYLDIIKEIEAENIFKIFRIINNAGYRPDTILFSYKADSEGDKHQRIIFKNWIEYLTVSQIMDVIEQEITRPRNVN